MNFQFVKLGFQCAENIIIYNTHSKFLFSYFFPSNMRIKFVDTYFPFKIRASGCERLRIKNNLEKLTNKNLTMTLTFAILLFLS